MMQGSYLKRHLEVKCIRLTLSMPTIHPSPSPAQQLALAEAE